jgi:hypothetical protein
MTGYELVFIVGLLLGIIAGRAWGSATALKHLGRSEHRKRTAEVNGERRRRRRLDL